MPEGDIIRKLLRGHVQKDEELFRRAAQDLIQQERKLNHRLLADDLERILVNGKGLAPNGNAERWNVPKDKERGLPLLVVSEPATPWDAVVLPPDTLALLRQCADEIRNRDLLTAAGVRPKQKVLLFGPPGCGKTLSASAIATELGWPLTTVRLDTVVSSYLGETASNLRRIFDFVNTTPCVALFDECDALAKERASGTEHGELQRVVSALLQMIDGASGRSVLVFATNHEQLLDTALWRRFDIVVSFGLPALQDRILMLRHFLRSFPHDPAELNKVARSLAGASGADVEWFALEAVRRVILSGRAGLVKDDFDVASKAFSLRRQSVTKLTGVPVVRPRGGKARR